MASRPDGFLGRALDRLEEFTGYTVVDTEHNRVQEAVAREAYFLANDLEEIGYVSMNYLSGRPSEPNAVTRKRWAQQARVVWLAEPMAGASVEMLNEFTFGRGVARPRFKDKEAQEVVDEAWDDPQNQRVLTSFLAQIKLGNSLSVQSNVFYTMHDDGEDGKVKLSFLNHDSVREVMTDPEVRQRALFYVASKLTQEWDFQTHSPKPTATLPKVYYYENWAAVEEAIRERGVDEDTAKKILERYRNAGRGQGEASADAEEVQPVNPGEVFKVPGADDLQLPPPGLLGEGKIYHLTDGNLDMEMIFGVPRMRRTIRWYTAYNDFMKARVDMMKAAAAFIMTKEVTGTPNQLEKLASKAMRATSDLRGAADTISPSGVKMGPRPGSILAESGGVKFEPFNLNSGASNAVQDGQMLRAQVSAGDRFPQHYLGDVGSANLATATSMELPVLKHVEARQELIEGLFRWFIDRVIERAIDVHRLDPSVSTEPEDAPELLRTQATDEDNAAVEGAQATVVPMWWRINKKDVLRETQVVARADGSVEYLLLAETHEDKNDDEQQTGRDLSYEFGMPSPLRRLTNDLVAAAAQTATMADPNGVNTELTRVLLTYIFAEGFEMQDASDLVERVFPKGYDPMAELAKAQQAMGQPGGQPGGQQPNFFGPDSAHQPPDPTNPYGAPKRATAPENVPGAQEGAWLRTAHGWLLLDEGLFDQSNEWESSPSTVIIGRHGQPIFLPGRMRGGQREGQVDMRVNARTNGISREFDRDMRGVTMDALAEIDMERMSGNGNHRR